MSKGGDCSMAGGDSIHRQRMTEKMANNALFQPFNRLLLKETIRLANEKIKNEMTSTRVVVIESTWLFDVKWNEHLHEVWFVSAPKWTIVQRLMDTYMIDEEEAKRRWREEFPVLDSSRQCNVVLSPLDTFERTKAQVTKAWTELMMRVDRT